MQRRRFLALIAAAPAALAACGSDGTTLPPAGTTAEPDSAATVPNDDGPGVAVENTDVVLSLTYEGGFTTREFAFQNPPALLVTGDGRVITPAVTTAVFPGPLLPQHRVQSITPAGIEQLVEAVGQAGLLEDVDLEYTAEIAIADASTTVLAVATDDMSIRHEAYALGAGGGPGELSESSPGRQALLDLTDRLRNDLGAIVEQELGDAEPWVPETVQITVVPMSGVDLGAEATIVDWPESSSIPLATSGPDTSRCREIDDPDIVALLRDADQTTFFRAPGRPSPDDVFQVIARPAYPGRSCEA